MKTDPWRASILYITSGLLDAIDGHLARTLNQGSKLGAMLDMLIDRMATMCLCAALVHFYPDYMLFFQAYMAIDIVSHWFHVQGSLMTGNTSHKVLDLSANPILRHYYHNKLILFVMCAANELFFCMLYLCYFTQGPTLLFGVGLWKALLCICAPLSFIKTGISLLQLWAAMTNIATLDMEERKKMKAK
ncbi:CDP-diacylglycerol--inositol 3-phosphatidyltransferase-like isoform X2 [Dreissena polymorpha]|nr:CDP-diacylglycerol--inositol 3-phosphatidyltransferase-like isoform X2 [Dreissena polymorpha]XP_052242332.1 CDP-diacylglycerol--inositol 3-phosphatidyltransferase-like isoform X2 [Dreissena polymorpha]